MIYKRQLASWLIGLVAAIGVSVSLATPVFSNALMLLMDRENFIPVQSSIWTFEPYAINQGSSNYWIYGQDRVNYYHFSHSPQMPYRLIAKRNTCLGFDKHDVRTWCTP